MSNLLICPCCARFTLVQHIDEMYCGICGWFNHEPSQEFEAFVDRWTLRYNELMTRLEDGPQETDRA